MEEGSFRDPLRWPRAMADWICAGRDDYDALLAHRTASRHSNLRRVCVWIWIVAAAVMALWPEIPVILGLTLTATFLCFALLDNG